MARKQHGLITRAQLLQTGVHADAIWRQLESRDLEEALPSVYRLPGAPRTWFQSLMAACLWAGEGAVASHRAAAALWGLDGFDEGPLEITTAKKNQLSARFRVHRAVVPPGLVTSKRGIPVTNAARAGDAHDSLRDRHGFLFSGIISALAFGAVHYRPSPWQNSILLIVVICFVGFGLAYVYERRGNLLANMAAHATFNAIGFALILSKLA